MANQSTTDKHIFIGVRDAYNGLIVKSVQEPHDRSTMQNLLKGIFWKGKLNCPSVKKIELSINKSFHVYLFVESLKVWVDQDLRGIWFEVDNKEHSEWIPVLVQVNNYFKWKAH